MNPDWLLKHFDQISEAPDAVPRMRRFILDLAVRGKLLSQIPADESGIHHNEARISRFQESSVSSDHPLLQLYELRHLAVQITDGEHATPPRISKQHVPLVTAKNVRNGTLNVYVLGASIL